MERSSLNLFELGNYGITPSLLAEIQTVAEQFTKQWESEKDQVESNIREELQACILELTNKTPIYAVLVMQIHVIQPECATAIHHQLAKLLSPKSSWRRWKVIIRFYAESAKLGSIDPADVLKLEHALLAVLDDMAAKEERKDCAVNLLLSTLPWAGALLQSVFPSELEAILGRLESYMSMERQKRLIGAQACRVFVQNSPYEQVDSLQVLWQQTKHLASEDWVSSLLTDARMIMPEPPRVDPVELPIVQFPMDSPSLVYPPPRTYFTMLAPEVVTQRVAFEASIPPRDSIDCFVLRDVLGDLLFYFDTNHIEFLNFYSTAVLFDACGSVDIPNDACKYNLHQVLIELLFDNIMCLPSSDLKSVYYSVVIMDLCKKYLKDVPPILGKFMYTFFERVESFDVEIQNRFTSWFAHHLSNFDYRWNWKEWAVVNELPEDSAKTLLVKEVLEKCVRLSYLDRVQQVLPVELDFQKVLPPQGDQNFKYAGGKDTTVDPKCLALCKRLIEGMRLKQSFDELQTTLTEIAAYGGQLDSISLDPEEQIQGMSLARDMLVQCVMQLGCKSFSHMLNMVERHLKLLEWVNATAYGKLETIRTIANYWCNNKQFFMLVIDKLVNYRIIDPTSVIEWVFGAEDGVPHFNRSFVWTLLFLVMNKVNARVLRVSKKLESMRKATYDPTEDETDKPAGMDVDIEGIESTQEELDALQREQKQTYITVFQHFIRVLTPALETEQEQSTWFQWGEGMMREVGRRYHQDLKSAYMTLEMTVFTPDVPERLKHLFQQVRNIHA